MDLAKHVLSFFLCLNSIIKIPSTYLQFRVSRDWKTPSEKILNSLQEIRNYVYPLWRYKVSKQFFDVKSSVKTRRWPDEEGERNTWLDGDVGCSPSAKGGPHLPIHWRAHTAQRGAIIELPDATSHVSNPRACTHSQQQITQFSVLYLFCWSMEAPKFDVY